MGRLRDQRGILLIEVVIASGIFMIVSTAIVGLLVSTTSLTRLSKERTVAEEGVASQIETIRGMQYDRVGTTAQQVTCSPAPCTIPASQVFTGINGQSLGVAAHLITQVTYRASNVPGAYVTGADFKKVVVKVTRDSDGKVLAQDVTFLAPDVRQAQDTATINARVIDFGTNAAMPDVTVNLSTGPSAPRSDVTDAAGNVTFGGLTRNPTSGPTAYYDIAAALPPGYVALADPTQTHVQLAPTQTFTSTLNIYQPGTINVALQNPSGTTYTGAATVTVSSSRGSHTFSYTGSTLSITTLNPPSGELLVPGLNYTVTITAAGRSVTPSPQTVFMAAGPNPTVNVSATVAQVASKLVFTSAPVSGVASSAAALGPITVQQQDSTGAPVVATGTGTVVNLSSDSAGATFALTPGGVSVGSVTIPSGSSSTTFYYGDTKSGTPTITGHNAAIATDATQQETISASAPAQLFFSTSALSGPASASATLGPVTVQRFDAYGNPVTAGGAMSVTLSSTSTGAKFSLTSGGAAVTTVTIAANASSASFYYGDTKAGTPTIRAHSGVVAVDATQVETIGAAKLVFTSGAVSGTASATAGLGPITVQRQDATGTAVTTGGALTVSLSSSTTGTDVYSLSANGAQVTTVTIPAGSASATFYYGDTKSGTPTVTAHAASIPTDATQAETITPGAVSKIVFTTNPVSGAHTTGPTSKIGPITIERQDAFGNPVTTGSVTISLSSNTSGTSKFSLTSNGTAITSVTIAAGASTATFYYGDTKRGSPKITAHASSIPTDGTQTETVT